MEGAGRGAEGITVSVGAEDMLKSGEEVADQMDDGC